MKKLSCISLALFANTCLAGGLSDGTYRGAGLWYSERGTGSYSVTTAIQGNKVSAVYDLPDGSKKEWIFDMDPSSTDFFKVKASGKEIGSGYCLEKADVCHYEIQIVNMKLEETLTLQNNKLYRFGSKDEGTGRVVWQETMDKD